MKCVVVLDVLVDCFLFKEFEFKKEYEEVILYKLKEKKIDLIVLVGYMWIIGLVLLENYDKRIINIYLFFLFVFFGLYGICDVFEVGVKEMGVIIYYID